MSRDHTLWDLTKGLRLRYAAAIGAMGLGIVVLFCVPLVVQRARDGEIGFWTAGAWVVGLTAVAGVFHYLRGRWAAIASEKIVRRTRDRLYAHLERLPSPFHDHADTGDLVQRCTSDVETVRVFLSGQIVEIGRVILLLLAVLPIMLHLHPRMTGVTLGLFPVIFVGAVVFFRRVKALFLEVDEAEGRLTTVLQENLTGVRVVRAFARQEFECGKFAQRNGKFRNLHYRLIRLLGVYWGLSDLVCLSQAGIVLIVGAHWVAAGELSVGTLYVFMAYLAMVIWPLRHLGRVLTDTGKAIVALGRLHEILAEAPESVATRTPDRPLRGAITVAGLRFSFDSNRAGDGETNALDGFDLSVAAGETVALLGPPGSGKSTLVQLLLRLYDYTEGSIRLDGQELSELDRYYVRRQIGVVLQEPFLYSKTVGQNVRLGRSAASHEEIVEAAADACIHASIEEFEHGYDTLVGERGVTLSGGQRQRLALARALLKDPPILVLDDALSAVDTDTEARILAALQRRHGRHTTLIIAHRLSSVLAADRIVVMEHGHVVQCGPHRALVQQEGPYRRLWRIQGALEEEISQA